MIMSAETGSFKNTDISTIAQSNGLTTVEGTSLSSLEISKFSDFTIETFYKVHTNYYPSSEIDVFKEHQGVFFALPYHFVRHEVDNQIVAYMTAALLEQHPFFKEPSWHIGYWGIAPTIRDRQLRTAIKHDWGKRLTLLNQTTRVGGNIDYFNKSAISMATNFGMKVSGYRMDPR
jgi:hypothetical protein